MKANNYLLISTSGHLLDQKIASILKEKEFHDGMVTYYDLEEDTLEDVLEDLDTISFLTPKKAVIAKNARFLEAGGKEEEKILLHLEKYLEQEIPSLLCIFTVEKPDDRKKIVKKMKSRVEVCNLTPDIMTYTRNLFSSYKVEKAALSLLIEYCREDYDKIFMESEKLKLYRFDEKEVRKEDVIALVEKPLEEKDQLAFSLSRSIAERKKKQSLEIYQNLSKHQVEPHTMIGLMESQYRLLYQVKILEEKGMRKDEIASYLSVHPFRVSKTMELTRYYSLKEISAFLKDLAKLDFQIKTGKMDSKMAIEMLILNN